MSAPSSSSPRLHEEIVEHVRGKRALFVVGTGVSLGATGMAPTASWKGLIDDGLGYCAELDPARKGWAERYKAALQNVLGGTTELIAIASMLEQMLGGGDRRGGNWSGWLGKTLGRLNVTDRSVVDQLHTLGQGRLATCNYDDVLTADNYPPVTWKNAASITQVLSGEASGVVHLHGHWSTPDSVALGFSSYAALLNDEAAQSLQRSMASLSSLVFVGFGAGLEDPNFGALLRWVSKTFAERQAHHFWLVKDGDVESANRAAPEGSRVIVLGYGPRHSDLHGFLLDLADRAGLNDKPIEDEDFVGRIAEIKAFKERLAKWLREPPLPWCVAIDGLGGAGKTSLAQMLLEETETSSVQSVRVLKNTIMKISESRQVSKLQLELAQAVSEVTHVPFARFNKALKTRAKSIERSSAWHEDLRGALDGKRLAIFLDDYERICRYPRSDPAQPRDDTLEEEDERRPFCHDWVCDAIVRSAPLGVCWILAGRGSSRLELPKEGTQVFRLRGLERGAVFKLVKGSGSTDPLADTNRLMAATEGHALAVRVALRGRGFPDDEKGHESLSASDADVVVRTLRYLWLEKEAGSTAAGEREAVVALVLAGGLPTSIADSALKAAGLGVGDKVATQLFHTFPELFPVPGTLDAQVASSLMRALKSHRLSNVVDHDRVATLLLEALRQVDREVLAGEVQLALDAAVVSLTVWLRPQDGAPALARLLLRAHVSSPGLRRAIAELETRPPVTEIAGWEEVSRSSKPILALEFLRKNTKDRSLRNQLTMACDALRFVEPNALVEVNSISTEPAEQALKSDEWLGREVAAYWLRSVAQRAGARGLWSRAERLWSILEQEGPSREIRDQARVKLALRAAHVLQVNKARGLAGDDATTKVKDQIEFVLGRAKGRMLKQAHALIESRNPEAAHSLMLHLANEYPDDSEVLERLVHATRRADADGPAVPDDPAGLTSVRLIIYFGELALRDGQFDMAQQFFQEAQRRAQESLEMSATRGNHKLLGSAINRLAEVALHQGRLIDASTLLSRRIALGDELADDPNDTLSSYDSYEAYRKSNHEKATTKHARARAGFVMLLLGDSASAAKLFQEAIALDANYFHAYLGLALTGVDPQASLLTAMNGARGIPKHRRDSILELDLALLAILAGEEPATLPPWPRDAGKLLLFALRVEVAARSHLSSGAVRDLRAALCEGLASRPPWLNETAPGG